MDEKNWLSENYVFEEKLGEGAFGGVWKATQASTQRQVAVKFYKPNLVKGGREVKIHSQLPQHPHLVTVFDAGHSSEGPYGAGPYMVMEYLSGGDLWRTRQQNGSFDSDTINSICSQIGQALAFIHQQGVIHRDIKPQNILFDDKTGFYKLGDFGIARDLNTILTVTQSQSSAGSIAFIAPEVASGEHLGDGSSDLYSFGAVMYWLWTGRLPLGRFKAPKELNTIVSDKVNLLIENLLEPDPDHRIQSSQQLVNALATPVRNSNKENLPLCSHGPGEIGPGEIGPGEIGPGGRQTGFSPGGFISLLFLVLFLAVGLMLVAMALVTGIVAIVDGAPGMLIGAGIFGALALMPILPSIREIKAIRMMRSRTNESSIGPGEIGPGGRQTGFSPGGFISLLFLVLFLAVGLMLVAMALVTGIVAIVDGAPGMLIGAGIFGALALMPILPSIREIKAIRMMRSRTNESSTTSS